MFRKKKKKQKDICSISPKDIKLDDLVIGPFWSGKTWNKPIIQQGDAQIKRGED